MTNPFTGTDYACPCGDTFAGAGGVLHGQPAALWRLLEHQAREHGQDGTMTDDTPDDLTDAQKHFITRALAGFDYARDRWANADDHLVLRHAAEIGYALDEQGLDGANEKAAEIETRIPSLRRK